MRGGNEGNVFRPHILQLLENVGKLVRGNLFAPLRAGYFVVLTKGATEIAPAKKDSAAPFFKGNARFFKGV